MLNPLQNRYFSGERAVDPLANFNRESVVKLHDAVSADFLGISRFEGKNIRVDSSTMENLNLAQETLRQVKMMLPYGAGNQKADIIATQGESAVRVLMHREKSDSPFPMVNAREAARYQAGNCHEHADLAYTLLAGKKVDAPVQIVDDKNWEHEYVLIGDPRDQTWGEQKTVVVDPWVRLPTAATLAQTSNRNPESHAQSQRERNAEPAPAALALHNIKHVTSAEVAQFIREEHMPQIGPEFLAWILNPEIPEGADASEAELLDEKNVAKDPSTRYSSHFFNAASMDSIAKTTVDHQKAAQRAWDEMRAMTRD
ncbi:MULTISPECIES: type III effector [unclassified Brenneria]|uniref:type III effector n=1 Tax=unclassified Brenneria TaxID=2634434 RepID=UPI001555AE72|nr:MULTISPECIES: type III effector [unclassified Brenneria]MBJ7221840.1 hypothetical protein [Brenneria sp. L3-3C-1]MEE3643083.1 hypothetical protein [Brenneria sp. L3_3C_1]MEE3650731.1 hypothetical protein [Brenneria sp. HEZEL_4_2_4]NPD00686.1 type III effector [Brenneria sp. hezel4-2-4]